MLFMNALVPSKPSFPIKVGSKGKHVKFIQSKLGLVQDGIFGPQTKFEVMEFQKKKGLTIDGIVGPNTWAVLETMPNFKEEDLDSSRSYSLFDQYNLDDDEYLIGQSRPEYIFFHHTAGWEDPYKVIRNWNNDARGRIGTEFVIGGQSIYNNNNTHDGVIVRCMEDSGWAYHLGKVKSSHMHKNSVGIEVCNFGQLTEGGYKNREGLWVQKTPGKFYTYAGQQVNENQIFDLGYEWRGYRYWHNYSDAQIDALYNLTKYLSHKYEIDLTEGLQALMKEFGDVESFDYYEDACTGKIKGVLTHSNVRKTKTDMYPHPKLIQMIKSL